jgi:hypothetical protein
LFIASINGSALSRIHGATFAGCSSGRSIDHPPSVDIDGEALLWSLKSNFKESLARYMLKKKRSIPFPVTLRIALQMNLRLGMISASERISDLPSHWIVNCEI